MAVTAKWFTNGPKHLVNGDVDWDDNAATTVKCALLDNTVAPDQDADEFFDDLTNEISGTGYTAGGEEITTKAVSVDTASNETRLDGDDVSWSAASFTARYAIVYMDSGTPSTSPLLGYVDFGGDETVSAGTFSITWDSTGVLKITAS